MSKDIKVEEEQMDQGGNHMDQGHLQQALATNQEITEAVNNMAPIDNRLENL